MDFKEVVKQRYSCKKFNGRAVDEQQLAAILEAGRLAPTAKNLQEQRIYIVQSEEGLAKIDAITPCRYGAPTVLVVAFDTDTVFTYPGGERDSGIEDATIVATHMLIAAADAGVDSCWINLFDPAVATRELGLPENEEVLMLLDLGYAAEGAGPLKNHFDRKPLEETVSYLEEDALDSPSQPRQRSCAPATNRGLIRYARTRPQLVCARGRETRRNRRDVERLYLAAENRGSKLPRRAINQAAVAEQLRTSAS